MVSYDKMKLRLGVEHDKTDEYVIVLDMGADNTTLVVTNGAKIWIRNVPIGGNHFTRALTKEMKLTFAKAEHLKCNATKAPDPRAVFQALRPVFNDYVSEIQRSIGYFSSVNRSAKIQKIVGVGNGFKLAGLQKFLHQNLQYDVERLTAFDGVAGDTVVGDPMFQENILTFAVPYGLALQGLKLTRIHTSLLPPEIVVERKIRAKKPWAAAAAAAMLFGVALSGVGFAMVAQSVSTERFGEAESKVAAFQSTVTGFQTAYDQKKTDNQTVKTKGQVLIDNLERRDQWLELYRAINEALPKDTQGDPKDPRTHNRIHLQSVTQLYVDDLAGWYRTLGNADVVSMAPVDRKAPTGGGFVVTLRGYHYHPDGHNFEIRTLLESLKQWRIGAVPVREMGITHAVQTQADNPIPRTFHPDPQFQRYLNTLGGQGGPGQRTGRIPGGEGADFGAVSGQGQDGQYTDEQKEELNKQTVQLNESPFTIQFVWQPVLKSDRALDNLLWDVLSKNPAATTAEIQPLVDAYNEDLRKRKLAGQDADKQPLALSEEKLTAFRTKHVEEGNEVPPEAAGVGGGVSGAGGYDGAEGGGYVAPPSGGGGHAGL
jgi:type IV pilus assembly protein PilM